MKIVLASSEVVPFAKTGGLADVAGALPIELARQGHEITVFMPAYQCIHHFGEIESTDVRLEIPIGHDLIEGKLLKSKLPDSNINVYFVEQPDYFDRVQLYGEKGDYEDNCERFTFFCRSVLESIRILDLGTELIHANDWQTGLIPALLKCEYGDNPIYKDIACLLTIHNLAYQGVFPPEKMSVTGLDQKYFNWRQMEFHGQLNLLKTGLVFADTINTVSPTYAQEIQGAEQGCGLEGVLQFKADILSGILNGIDTSDWSPSTDQHLPAAFDSNFDVNTGSEGKATCKAELQKEAMLEVNPDVPLIGIVGRLASQKGWSLILPVLRNWLADREVQWVILGTGDPDYHHVLTTLHRSHPNKLALTLGFSNEFAHRIEAGSDIFVMPSQYEPCGLNQMYSMAYGTIPVVRRTGGLADTVVNVTPDSLESQTANGFSFQDFTSQALEESLNRAVSMFRNEKPTWRQLMLTGMNRDWSWSRSANQYEALYRETKLRKSHS